MEQTEARKIKNRKWVVGVVVALFALLAVAMLVQQHILNAGSAAVEKAAEAQQRAQKMPVSTPAPQHATAPTSTSESMAAQATTPSASSQPAASPTSDSGNNQDNASIPAVAPPPDNCHDSPVFIYLAKKSGHPISVEGRKEYATEFNQKMLETERIAVIANGEDAEILQFITGEPNEPALRSVISTMPASIRAGICAEGFSKVQFLLMNQEQQFRVISEFPTSEKQFRHYVMIEANKEPR